MVSTGTFQLFTVFLFLSSPLLPLAFGLMAFWIKSENARQRLFSQGTMNILLLLSKDEKPPVIKKNGAHSERETAKAEVQHFSRTVPAERE